MSVRYEYELYAPVRDWLHARGFVVFIETFDCDVIGRRGDHIVVVELKKGLNYQLFKQLVARARWADEVYACVPTKTKSDGQFVRNGFGILRLANGKLKLEHKARPQPWYRERMRLYRLKKLTRISPVGPNEVAGLPSGGFKRLGLEEVQA